jgi:hypothetical protein
MALAALAVEQNEERHLLVYSGPCGPRSPSKSDFGPGLPWKQLLHHDVAQVNEHEIMVRPTCGRVMDTYIVKDRLRFSTPHRRHSNGLANHQRTKLGALVAPVPSGTNRKPFLTGRYFHHIP